MGNGGRCACCRLLLPSPVVMLKRQRVGVVLLWQLRGGDVLIPYIGLEDFHGQPWPCGAPCMGVDLTVSVLNSDLIGLLVSFVHGSD